MNFWNLNAKAPETSKRKQLNEGIWKVEEVGSFQKSRVRGSCAFFVAWFMSEDRKIRIIKT